MNATCAVPNVYVCAAGRIMLECAQRLARDPRLRSDPAVLRTQYSALTAAINAYKLCDARTAWDLRQQGAARPSSPLKRKAASREGDAGLGETVGVVDLPQMQADCVLARGQLRLLDHGSKPGDVTLLSPSDLIAALCQQGLFSTAADVALSHKVGLTTVVDSLARRCVLLQRDPTAPCAHFLFVSHACPAILLIVYCALIGLWRRTSPSAYSVPQRRRGNCCSACLPTWTARTSTMSCTPQ